MVEKTIKSEGNIMAQTKEERREANKKAVAKYHADLMLFKVQPKKEEGEIIRAFCCEHGLSAQKLFLLAVREYMAKAESGEYCVNLGSDLGERTAMIAKAKETTIEEYVRNAVTEQRKRDIQAFGNIEFGKRSKDKIE